MRIAVVGLNQETNTFSPHPTTYDNFMITRGADVLTAPFWDEYRREGVEWIPILEALAIPQGRVTRDGFLQLEAEIMEGLRAAMPLDGVCLHWHGAMEVVDIGCGEGHVATAIGELVGPDVPIVADLDMHGNLSQDFVHAVNVITTLRTAPHRDGEETQRRGIERLLRCIREGLRPVTVMVDLPLLLTGEYTVTDVEPCKSLYTMIDEAEAVPGIMDASIMIGFAWSDSPRAGVSIVVVAERESDRDRARTEARRMAEAVWSRRAEFETLAETTTVEDSIARALAEPKGPVFISDSGDNITAGAAGDTTVFVEALLAAKVPDALMVGVIDPETVARCAAAGIDAEVSVILGGKIDTVHGKPLDLSGCVSMLDPLENPTLAILQVEGVAIIVTSDWYPFWSLSQFEKRGIDPFKHHIVVLKNGYLPPCLGEHATRSIMATSPGFGYQDLSKLKYENLTRPIYPFDGDFEWSGG